MESCSRDHYQQGHYLQVLKVFCLRGLLFQQEDISFRRSISEIALCHQSGAPAVQKPVKLFVVLI